MRSSARAEEAALLWDDLANNLCVDSDLGDPAATDHAFAKADHIVELAVHVGRVTGVPYGTPRGAGDL